ncbi:MAG: 2'-5' RNA ligase family protein [Gammaproteobacteria bacterium]
MKKKYNIALVPKSCGEEVVKISQQLSGIADKYQLGDKSLPHVTLCQFEAEEKEIDTMWENVCNTLQEHSLELEFKDFSCITFNNVFWVSIMPDKRSLLDKMHQTVANTVKANVNKYYDPHMTIISTKDNKYQEKAAKITKLYSTISDTFILSVGECDPIGQLTKLLHKCEVKNGMTHRM